MCGNINTDMKTPDDFLNAKQTAKYLGFSYEMARAMFRLGQIPTVMVGTRKLTTKALLAAWMRGQGAESPTQVRQDDHDEFRREFPVPFST
jgi:hypothetical protein